MTWYILNVMAKNGVIIRKQEEVQSRLKEYKDAMQSLQKPANKGGAITIVLPAAGPEYNLECADLCTGKGDWAILLA